MNSTVDSKNVKIKGTFFFFFFFYFNCFEDKRIDF